MANALQLFNFQPQALQDSSSSTQKTKTKKRKRKVIAPNAKGISVTYFCSICKKEITIDTASAIQCQTCDNRVVDKVRVGKSVTYDAV